MGWVIATETPKLTEGDVHVWSAALSAPGSTERFAALLNRGEHLRADRFLFEEDRRRFIVCHALLRILIERYTGRKAEGIRFRRNRWGKPFLIGPGPSFSISYSGDMALFALADKRQVGVDIERMREEFPGMEIARRFFSPREAQSLGALDDPARTAAFFDCWARKEALVKAIGRGLHVPLDAFDVSLDPAAPALLAARFEGAEGEKWQYGRLPKIEGYAAALAFEGAAAAMRTVRFPSEWLP